MTDLLFLPHYVNLRRKNAEKFATGKEKVKEKGKREKRALVSHIVKITLSQLMTHGNGNGHTQKVFLVFRVT